MSFYCEMHRIQILYTVPKEHTNDLYTCCWSYIIWAQLQQGNFKPTGLRWHMVSFMDDRIFLSLSVKSSDFFCLLCHLWTQVLCFRFASFLPMTCRGTNNLTKAKGHTDLYIDDKNTGVLVTNTYESNEGGTDNHERGKGTKTWCQTSRRRLRRKQPSHWNRKQTKDN